MKKYFTSIWMDTTGAANEAQLENVGSNSGHYEQ